MIFNGRFLGYTPDFRTFCRDKCHLDLNVLIQLWVLVNPRSNECTLFILRILKNFKDHKIKSYGLTIFLHFTLRITKKHMDEAMKDGFDWDKLGDWAELESRRYLTHHQTWLLLFRFPFYLHFFTYYNIN